MTPSEFHDVIGELLVRGQEITGESKDLADGVALLCLALAVRSRHLPSAEQQRIGEILFGLIETGEPERN